MPGQYDASTKWLIDRHPQDWLKLLGRSTESVEVVDVEALDTDLATVAAAADCVFRVRRPAERLHHFELETGHHGDNTPFALLRYSVLLTGKYRLPVDSAVILLRPEADSPALKRPLEYRREDGVPYLSFQYNVVRIWEKPVEMFLSGGLGTLPLAPLADVQPRRLPDVVRSIQRRLDSEAGDDAGELWTAIEVLMGLRYTVDVTNSLLQGIRQMRDSVTYQAIVEQGEAKGRVEGEAKGRVEGEAKGRVEGEAKGRVEEARALCRRIANKRLGKLPSRVQKHLSKLTGVEEIERLIDRILEIESWRELAL